MLCICLNSKNLRVYHQMRIQLESQKETEPWNSIYTDFLRPLTQRFILISANTVNFIYSKRFQPKHSSVKFMMVKTLIGFNQINLCVRKEKRTTL